MIVIWVKRFDTREAYNALHALSVEVHYLPARAFFKRFVALLPLHEYLRPCGQRA